VLAKRKSKLRRRSEGAATIALVMLIAGGVALLSGAFAGLVLMLLLGVLHADFIPAVPAAGFAPCWCLCACTIALLDILRRK
jgi:hypothetical protein